MEPQFVFCRCDQCGGKIEFDSASLDPQEHLQIECPHCHGETFICIPRELEIRAVAGFGEIPPLIPIDYFLPFVGQSEIKERLKGIIGAAKNQNKLIPNVLIEGANGSGKSLLSLCLANSVAQAFSNKIHFIDGTESHDINEFVARFCHLNENDVMMVDKMDELEDLQIAILKDAMVEFAVFYGGTKINFPRFRVIANVQNKKELPAPFLLCFPQIIEIQEYSPQDIKLLITECAKKQGFAMEEEAMEYVSDGCKYPVHVINLIDFARSYILSRDLEPRITLDVIRGLFSVLGAHSEEEEFLRESIPAEVKREVWRRDQGKCARCGSRERLEYDHIIPVSKGGSNTVRNIELLCEAHNRAKSANI